MASPAIVQNLPKTDQHLTPICLDAPQLVLGPRLVLGLEPGAWSWSNTRPFLATSFPVAPRVRGSGFPAHSEGPPKFFGGPPRVFAKSQTHPPTSRLFFLGIFLSTFSGVSRQGEFKNTMQMFMSKTFPKKTISFLCQFLLDFFLFYRGFGCFLAMGVQKQYQKQLPKIVSKSFYKKNRQKIQNRLFLGFVFKF
jgi:hypothetical protein